MRVLLIAVTLLMFTASCKSKKSKSQEAANEVTEESLTNIPDPKSEGAAWIKDMKKELSDSLFLRLKRTACFGRCPIYTLSIYIDGTVVYEGEKWVEREGNYNSRVNQTVLEQIQNKADSIEFKLLDEVYDNLNVTDLPATITVLKDEEDFKVVVNRYGAPEKLNHFEDFIDKMVKNLDWEKIEEQ